MENEMQVEAFPRKFWNVMRVFFFMLRKGISKRKLSLHLNMMLKRSKIAGKALGNLMFHHHSASTATAADLCSFYAASAAARKEYEFSCSSTPAHHKFLFKKKQHQSHYEAQYEGIDEEFMEMMGLNDAVAASSPALPGLLGFKQQLRVTDSPFPVSSGRVDEGDCHVDEAADDFIKRFYTQLRRQALTDA